MTDLSIHPVYLSARAAIIAPERAIPVTLYSTQKWLPRLGPERWCLVMLLRSMCIDSKRRGDGTKRVACSWRELAERFIQAIDATAMRVGAKDSDAYLAEWRRGTPEPCGDDLAAEADKAVAEIEGRYDRDMLVKLVNQSGWEQT